MKKQLDRIEAKLDEILRVETRLLKNTANVNGSEGLLQTIQAWSDSKNGVCLSERGELVYDGTQSIEPAQDIIINNLPSEPDWSTAPEWAQWFGINANGTAFWCNQKPFLQQYLYPDVWLVPKFSKFMTAQGLYDASNWVDAIFERPQAEAEQVTITAQLDTDIDGYLAGKKSFITAYVDLLLARMANEERFSDAVCVEESKAVKDYDVIVFEYDSKCVYAVVNQAFDYRIFVTVCAELDLIPMSCFEVDTNIVVVRTITELEAVEFRKAMEAVYG